jgi:hypothetical protein
LPRISWAASEISWHSSTIDSGLRITCRCQHHQRSDAVAQMHEKSSNRCKPEHSFLSSEQRLTFVATMQPFMASEAARIEAAPGAATHPRSFAFKRLATCLNLLAPSWAPESISLKEICTRNRASSHKAITPRLRLLAAKDKFLQQQASPPQSGQAPG